DRRLGGYEQVRPASLLVLLPPLAETAPHVLGADLERVADVLEGEEPGAVFRADPLASLIEHLVTARLPRVRVLLVTVDGVLQDGEHEQALALESALAAKRREELGRQENVRLEEARQPIVSGGEASLAFCDHLPLPPPVGAVRRPPDDEPTPHAYHGR